MVLRSMLFVPGNSMRLIVKSAGLPADAVILDLEDAVPLADKPTARVMVRDSVGPVRDGGASVFVRVNSLASGLTADDLKFICVPGLDGIMPAKTETADDVAEVAGMLDEVEKGSGLSSGGLAVIPLIESAKGVINAYEIASSSERVAAVAFGAGDYYRDLGRSVSSLSEDQAELLYARCRIVNGGRAAGVQAIDTPSFGLLTDKQGFERETLMSWRLGFAGKLLVHPAQIGCANRVFSASREDAEYSRRLVEAFEEAQAGGLGAISFEGKMIDVMSYRQAGELVKFVDIVAEMDNRRKSAPAASLSRFFVSC